MKLKDYYNELSREIAYAGPIVCRLHTSINVFQPANTSYGYNYECLQPGEIFLIFRGPLPHGAHKSPGGSRWYAMTSRGARWFDMYSMKLENYFKRIS